jgi:AcrR family transcriptional regulator
MNANLPFRGRRARTDESKAARKASLILAARERLAVDGVDAFTMADLATQAGVAKGTAYLYFSTKEELLLDLFIEDLTVFLASLNVSFNNMPAENLPDRVADAILAAMKSQPSLLSLMPVLHSHIEKNVPPKSLKDFKLFLLHGMRMAGNALERRLDAPCGHGLQLLMRTHAVAVGFSQVTNRNEMLGEVFSETPELQPIAISFDRAFRDTIADLMRAAIPKSQLN